jgi:hypothetical protein
VAPRASVGGGNSSIVVADQQQQQQQDTSGVMIATTIVAYEPMQHRDARKWQPRCMQVADYACIT